MHKKSFLENAADFIRRRVFTAGLIAGGLLGTALPSFGQQQDTDKPKPNAANNEIHYVMHPGIEGRILADTVINDLVFYYVEKGKDPKEDNTYWGVKADRSQYRNKHNISYSVKMSRDYAAYRRDLRDGKDTSGKMLDVMPIAAEELEARSKIYHAIHHGGRRYSTRNNARSSTRSNANEFSRAHVFADPSYGWFLYGHHARSDVPTMQGYGMSFGGETSIPIFRSNKTEQLFYMRAISNFYFENPDQINISGSFSNRQRQGTWDYTYIPGDVSLELGARTRPTSPIIAEIGGGARHYWGSRVNLLNRADLYGAGRLGLRFPAKGALQFEVAAKAQYTRYNKGWMKVFEPDAQNGFSWTVQAGLNLRPGLILNQINKKAQKNQKNMDSGAYNNSSPHIGTPVSGYLGVDAGDTFVLLSTMQENFSDNKKPLDYLKEVAHNTQKAPSVY